MKMKVGPRMAEVVDYVWEHPGCHPARVARQVGPHGSIRYGYRTVDRAIRAGLVASRPDPAHRGRAILLPAASPDAAPAGSGGGTLEDRP
jgi:hypothetical protein